MEIFEYIFYLGVINIVFSAGWKILATVISSLLNDVGINKETSFLVFKTLGYYILVSMAAMVTVTHMEQTYSLAAMAYAITGTFVIYATIASNLERNRWRAVMNYERKRIRVMRFDGYLLMACIVLFIVTLLKPEIANIPPHTWILTTIDKIFNTSILKYIIGFFAFFYMLNIIFRGIKASDEVFALLFNRKRSKTTTGNNNDDGSYTEYEEVTDDNTTLPK
ncbi:MAG: hypothetical protein IPI31_13265 [Bacteroidetes bacterium]|nr:hypothetical protein [Bacteroidota bacterium]MBK7568785.1 hypothetical protein [Bacteroidota bacterium]MBP8917769.1 hypothetical protein [Chitinophagales bacterium]